MSTILSLETSTEACSAALLYKGTLTHRFEIAPRMHSAKILPMIHELLEESKITLKDVDAIAVGRGPGSFTGVRLGISVAQGLSFGVGVPIIPVSTLEALALEGVRQHGGRVDKIVAALDARMNEMYFAVYEYNNGALIEIIEEQLIAPEILPSVDVSPAQTVIGCGHGFSTFSDVLAACLPESVFVYPECFPSAVSVALLAQERFETHRLEPRDCLPVYLRNQVIQSKD